MFIDSHCHLNFQAFKNDYHEVYQRAVKAGVKKLIIIGASVDSSQQAVEMAQELDSAYASVGVHPHHIKELQKSKEEEVKRKLTKLLANKKIVALGETGLDYYHYQHYSVIDKQTKKLQRKLLKLHLELAKEHNLPVIFHCRQAFDEMITYLSHLINQLKWRPRGVFHCFSGNQSHLNKILNMGFYVGFDGNISYKENDELRLIVKETPLHRLLIETDAPFLSPEPYRGQRNEPAYVKLVAEWVAKIKNKPYKQIVRLTTQNAHTLFKL